MLELSDAQKLMLVASCAGLVAATILVTVCVVTPHCWLYHCIWGKDDEKAWVQTQPMLQARACGPEQCLYCTSARAWQGHWKLGARACSIGCVWTQAETMYSTRCRQHALTERRKKLYYGTDVIPLPVCPVTTKPVSANGEKPVAGAEGGITASTPGGIVLLPFVRSRAQRDSTYSSMSTASSRGEASVYSDNSADVVTSVEGVGEEGEVVLGHATLSLRYQVQTSPGGNPPTTGYPAGKLLVNIREVQNLAPRAYGGICDPYVVVKILKGRIKKKRGSGSSLRRPSCIGGGGGAHCLLQYQTQVKRKTQCPLFNENFSADLAKGELKDCSLLVALFDLDKYSNDTEVGEALVALKELQLVGNPDEQILHLDLKEPKQHNGEILFGLSYLPTAERLTFSIMKASNLVSPLNNVESFFPCVRILLFHNGKLKKKKKTAPRQGTLCPVYNESLTFDVPQTELDRVVFLVVVSHRDPGQGGTLSSPDSPTTPVAGSPQQHVGKVLVGASSRGSVLHHWNAMKQSPRKQVTQWHTLR